MKHKAAVPEVERLRKDIRRTYNEFAFFQRRTTQKMLERCVDERMGEKGGVEGGCDKY